MRKRDHVKQVEKTCLDIAKKITGNTRYIIKTT